MYATLEHSHGNAVGLPRESLLSETRHAACLGSESLDGSRSWSDVKDFALTR